MTMRCVILVSIWLFAVGFGSQASAATVWNESLDGDLSTSPTAPTALAFGLGRHAIAGSISAESSDPRDYVTFTLAEGEWLVALLLQQWQDGSVGGPANRGFHAIQLGATSSIPGPGSIAGFLGSAHLDFAPAGTDLLPALATAALGGTGFTAPLGPGTYSYVVQQTGPQLNLYTLEFVVVPEPTTAVLFAVGLAGLAARRRCSAGGDTAP